ncbi:MAG: type II toxin-antitoxin system prevent-host-death family antitoxin [Bifidobacteriaceae bacterium]|nr:type II toxin-antitoxin system prevent-host-death family antitoxin [Bifidobacteriaceae bacterium]
MAAIPIDQSSPDLRHAAEAARHGHDVILTNGGEPVARIVPVAAKPSSTVDLFHALGDLPKADAARMQADIESVMDTALWRPTCAPWGAKSWHGPSTL